MGKCLIGVVQISEEKRVSLTSTVLGEKGNCEGPLGKMDATCSRMFREDVGDGGIRAYFSSDDMKKWPLPPPGGLKMGRAVSPADECVLMQDCLSVELEWERVNRSSPGPWLLCEHDKSFHLCKKPLLPLPHLIPSEPQTHCPSPVN